MPPIHIALASVPASSVKVDLLPVACDDHSLAANPLVTEPDHALGGSLRRASSSERFRRKPQQLLTLHTQERVPATRIALIGLGSRSAIAPSTLTPFAGRAARLAASTGVVSLALVPPAS